MKFFPISIGWTTVGRAVILHLMYGQHAPGRRCKISKTYYRCSLHSALVEFFVKTSPPLCNMDLRACLKPHPKNKTMQRREKLTANRKYTELTT